MELVCPLKVASSQCFVKQNDIEATLSHIQNVMEKADSKNIDIVCFPECYLQGYFLDQPEIQNVALDLRSPEFAQVLEAVKDFKATIILGLIEVDGADYYNTAVVIENGQLLGKYRKTYPNEGVFSPGKDYPVFEKNNVRYGINICSDANYPQAAQQLSQQGAKIIFFPLNNKLPAPIADQWRERSKDNLVYRAIETRCWVVSADIAHNSKTEKGYGCSLIVNPMGQIVEQAAEFSQSFICLC